MVVWLYFVCCSREASRYQEIRPWEAGKPVLLCLHGSRRDVKSDKACSGAEVLDSAGLTEQGLLVKPRTVFATSSVLQIPVELHKACHHDQPLFHLTAQNLGSALQHAYAKKDIILPTDNHYSSSTVLQCRWSQDASTTTEATETSRCLAVKVHNHCPMLPGGGVRGRRFSISSVLPRRWGAPGAGRLKLPENWLPSGLRKWAA